jgi:hypothetical protein
MTIDFHFSRRVTRTSGNNFAQFLEKSSQNSCQTKKCLNIFIEAQLASPNHQHQTLTKLLKYLKQTTFPPKKLPRTLKNGPSDKILPNLVTLHGGSISDEEKKTFGSSDTRNLYFKTILKL